MTTKEELVDNIKNWMQIDTEMKLLQKELKDRRMRKKQLTESLVEIMKSNEIDCFDITEGKIIYTTNKVKAPLSKKHLTECLDKYFAAETSIKADEISNFILESRVVKTNESIRHKPQKII